MHIPQPLNLYMYIAKYKIFVNHFFLQVKSLVNNFILFTKTIAIPTPNFTYKITKEKNHTQQL